MESLLSNYTAYKTARDEEDASGLADFTNATDAALRPGNATHYDEIADTIWLWTIIDGLLMVAILCGNTLTILAVTLSRRLSNLISNQFVLNLALSDLMVGLTLPYHLAFYLDAELGEMKGTCVLRFILITLACCASILNLIAIAVDRYVAILHPLHYSRYMSRAVTRAMMAVCWVVAVSMSVVPIFWNNWGMASSCDMHKVIPKEYTTNVLAPMFSLIWLVMFVLYWRIWREAALHARRMRTTTCCPAGPNDWKSVQVVLMVLGSFSLCWMPYVVVVCTQALEVYSPGSQILYKAVFSLAMANSGINPLIYAWKNTGFRKAFLRLLRCQSPDCPDFERTFRNTAHASSERKLPLETISQKEQSTPIKNDSDKDTKVLVKKEKEDAVPAAETMGKNGGADRNSRCRIIENLAYDDGLRCHIIENLGFEDTLDVNSLRMIDSAGRDSDEDSVATLAMEQTADALATHPRDCAV